MREPIVWTQDRQLPDDSVCRWWRYRGGDWGRDEEEERWEVKQDGAAGGVEGGWVGALAG
ncbi:hypothetical protein Dda_1321 [Drechslerella dactyloides]|uniref:Uncharacterized protein n=1 Tax=Drechslerella dactyloides TaxID=74499 RepID=A0AAD6NLC9_DREDA|nr:hypothetical protein Dda_1321 [Drechslerella dactyloides]